MGINKAFSCIHAGSKKYDLSQFVYIDSPVNVEPGFAYIADFDGVS